MIDTLSMIQLKLFVTGFVKTDHNVTRTEIQIMP